MKQEETQQKIWDCIIIGAGASGLSAAINGCSEGLSMLVIDKSDKTGGLIGTTSLIENYPGFPDGIQGRELTDNMEKQARKFGARFMMKTKVINVEKRGDNFVVGLSTVGSGLVIPTYTKCVVVATGRDHKKLGLNNEEELVKANLLDYGHPNTLVDHFKGHICIVGGGNSAGQAATWLTEHACQVTLVAPHFNHMSQYLIDRIKSNPALKVVMGKVFSVKPMLNGKSVVYVDDTDYLPNIDKTYSLIGLEVDDTFKNLKNEDGFLTNCIPGIFVAGDCRDHSEKRCTAAVGEGVMAISNVHKYLTSLK